MSTDRSKMTPPARRGMGAMVGLVMIILMTLAMMGISSFFQSSGTARTYSRVLDMRSAIEAGDSAISEAVVYVRRSLDSGWTDPQLCPDNWRQLMRDTIESNAAAPRSKRVVPKSSREVFRGEVPPLEIADVLVDVIQWYTPPPPASGGAPPEPAQGVVEFTVEVGGAQKVMKVRKLVRQRRVLYATVDPRFNIPGSTLPPDSEQFTLLTHPLATVIE